LIDRNCQGSRRGIELESGMQRKCVPMHYSLNFLCPFIADRPALALYHSWISRVGRFSGTGKITA
jgi:hypothetical protein